MEAKDQNQKLAFDLSLYILIEYKGNYVELLKLYRDILKNEKAKLPKKIV
jgi:hypothetical protein